MTAADPLQYVGILQCQTCGAESHPAAGAWLNGHLVLVDFRAACAHLDPAWAYWVIDVTQVQPAAPRCTYNLGDRVCSRRPAGDDELCWQHQRILHARRAVS